MIQTKSLRWKEQLIPCKLSLSYFIMVFLQKVNLKLNCLTIMTLFWWTIHYIYAHGLKIQGRGYLKFFQNSKGGGVTVGVLYLSLGSPFLSMSTPSAPLHTHVLLARLSLLFFHFSWARGKIIRFYVDMRGESFADVFLLEDGITLRAVEVESRVREVPQNLPMAAVKAPIVEVTNRNLFHKLI